MRLASQLVRDQGLIRPRPIYPTGADQQRVSGTTELAEVNLAAGGSANTDGSWTQIIASTAVAASKIHLMPRTATNASGNDSGILLDLATGDGSQNPVLTLVDDYQVGFNVEALNPAIGIAGFTIPIYVPQGVELIGRIRAAIASDTFIFSPSLYGGNGEPLFRKCTTYGAVPSASKGTDLATPGANNTKGAWTEIDGSISNPIYALGFGFGGAGSSVFASTRCFVDIGAGSAGNERVVVPDIYLQTGAAESIGPFDPPSRLAPSLDGPLGAGERLVARYQTTNTAQGLDVIVYGFS